MPKSNEEGEQMTILLKDGIKYLPYKYKDEDELEQLLIEHSEIIFGGDSVIFPKRKIKARSGIGTIPDGFVVLINERKWYILEVELASHPLYDHIVAQISKFNSAIKNQNTRKKLIDVFYNEIKNNIQIKYKLEFNGITKELYKFLSDIINGDPEVIIVIDERTGELDEVSQSLPFQTTILRFETYEREKIGVGVHIHSFDTLKDYKIKEEIQPPGDEKKPEEIGKKRIEITLPSNRPTKFAIIPLPKEYRSFFPGYKIPFILITDIGEIRTKVTSAPKGTEYGNSEAGAYIMGGLKPWYGKHSDLKEGDKLIIEVVEPKKRYRLYVEQ
jgi:hypothetical protein